MVINDATYLLDESLLALKLIHLIESEMESDSFNQLTIELRQAKRLRLAEAQRGVKSWLPLAGSTLDLFVYLTAAAREPFFQPVSFEYLRFGSFFSFKYLFNSCRKLILNYKKNILDNLLLKYSI